MLSESGPANHSRKLVFDVKDSRARSRKGLLLRPPSVDILEETSYQSVMMFRDMVFPSSYSKANSQVELAAREIQSSYGIKQQSDHDESCSPSTDSHPFISLSSSVSPPEVQESSESNAPSRKDTPKVRMIKIRKSFDSSQCRNKGLPICLPEMSEVPEEVLENLTKERPSRHMPSLRSRKTRSSPNDSKKLVVTFENRKGCLRKTRREELEVSDVLAYVSSMENRGQGIDVQIMKNKIIREQFEEYLENEVSGICTVKKVRLSK